MSAAVKDDELPAPAGNDVGDDDEHNNKTNNSPPTARDDGITPPPPEDDDEAETIRRIAAARAAAAAGGDGITPVQDDDDDDDDDEEERAAARRAAAGRTVASGDGITPAPETDDEEEELDDPVVVQKQQQQPTDAVATAAAPAAPADKKKVHPVPPPAAAAATAPVLAKQQPAVNVAPPAPAPSPKKKPSAPTAKKQPVAPKKQQSTPTPAPAAKKDQAAAAAAAAAPEEQKQEEAARSSANVGEEKPAPASEPEKEEQSSSILEKKEEEKQEVVEEKKKQPSTRSTPEPPKKQQQQQQQQQHVPTPPPPTPPPAETVPAAEKEEQPAAASKTVEEETQAVANQDSDHDGAEDDVATASQTRKEQEDNNNNNGNDDEENNNSGSGGSFLPPIRGARSTSVSDGSRLDRVDSQHHYAQATKSSSIKMASGSPPSRPDSITPGRGRDSPDSEHHNSSSNKRAWKPTSVTSDTLASARDLTEQMKPPPKTFGKPGPIRRHAVTNLFHQLHLAIYQRPPIRANSKISATSLASAAAATAHSHPGSGGGGGSSSPPSCPLVLPYSLIPPAAKNAANSVEPRSHLEPVSSLNSSIGASVYQTRKPPSSVLSILCVTGDADLDASAASKSSCLRVLPCIEDHRSVAYERMVPVPPREGVRLGTAWLGEDSMYLSRTFATFDGVAAYHEDWHTIADLIGGNFLAGAVAGGICRSGVVIINACPESDKVVSALCDGQHPFVNKVAEVLLSVCTEQELRAEARRALEEQERQQRDRDVKKAQRELDSESGVDFVPPSPRSARRAPGGKKIMVGGNAVMAAASSSPTAAAGAGAGGAATSPYSLKTKGAAVSGGAAPAKVGIAPGAPRVANLQQNAPPVYRSLVSIDPNDPLADFFSFDHIAVSAVDIAPGGGGVSAEPSPRSGYVSAAAAPADAASAPSSSSSPSSSEDTIFDVLTGARITLASRKRHVPKRLQPVVVSVVPRDETQSIECKTVQEVGDACSRIMAAKPTVPGSHRIVYLKLQKSGDGMDKRETADPTLQLTYEPTIMFVFLSPWMRRTSELHPARGADPKHNAGLTQQQARAVLRDHRELAAFMEHLAKYDGVGKDGILTQSVKFDGALCSLLSSGALLRADVAHVAMISAVKAFSTHQREAEAVVRDLDSVKRLPVHPRAQTSFMNQNLPPIELPPLVAKAAAEAAAQLKSPRPTVPPVMAKKKSVAPRAAGMR